VVLDLDRDGRIVCACAANRGYLEVQISFSRRIVHRRQAPTPTTNTVNATGNDDVGIIALLKGYASRDDWVLTRTRVDSASGPRQATSDSPPVESWERFKETYLEIVTDQGNASRAPKEEEIGQHNTLDTYFNKRAK